MTLSKIGNDSWKSRGSLVWEGERDEEILACVLKDNAGHWRVVPGNLDRRGFFEYKEAMSYVEGILQNGGW